MKHSIEVASREEGRQLEAGLQDPETRTAVRLVGILSQLPLEARNRVLEQVNQVTPGLPTEVAEAPAETPPAEGADA